MSKQTSTPLAVIGHASLARRFAIFVYDGLIILAMLILMGFVITAIKQLMIGNIEEDFQFTKFLNLLNLVLVPYIYHHFFWRKGGQTVGMKTWRVRVNNQLNSQGLNTRQCLIRYFGGWVSFCAFGLGYLFALRKNRQAWHDSWSNSELLQLEKKTKQ
jgi:uncharacterized RDD family membrane protein YckC